MGIKFIRPRVYKCDNSVQIQFKYTPITHSKKGKFLIGILVREFHFKSRIILYTNNGKNYARKRFLQQIISEFCFNYILQYPILIT